MQTKLYLPLAIPLLFGCGSLESAPYQVGHEVQYSTTKTGITKSYRLQEGGDPMETSGILGSGPWTCQTARKSAGTYTSEYVEEIVSHHKVIGTTNIDHPLKPDKEEGFGRYLASLVELTERSTESSHDTYTDFIVDDEDANTGVTTVTEQYDDDDVTTEASYYGVAHDEYLIKFELNQLWDLQAYELISRAYPETGDFWVSANGNTLFVYMGTEDFSLGGSTVKANKVAMYEASNIQKNGKDVLDDCLYQNSSQTVYDANNPVEDIEDVGTLTASIDVGCEGAFIHYQVGTQLWYNNMLVQEQKTYQEIIIDDWGYQKFEDESSGSNEYCSLTEPGTVNQAEVAEYTRYIEYTIDEIVETTEVVEWGSEEESD